MVTSLVLLAFGWAPRLTLAVWGVLVAFVVLGEFGALWDLPEWLLDLSPLRHAPSLPVGGDGLLAVTTLTAAAAAFSLLGYLGWRRRDLAA